MDVPSPMLQSNFVCNRPLYFFTIMYYSFVIAKLINMTNMPPRVSVSSDSFRAIDIKV